MTKISKEIKTETENLEHIIEAWFRKHFHNSAISRSEECIGIANRAKDDLKNILGSDNEPVLTTTNKE